MEIVIKKAEGEAPVSIMELQGELDASNYQEVIAQAQEVYDGGARQLLLDLSGLTFMGSSGLVALHSIAFIMRGEEFPDPEYGWRALRSIPERKEISPEKNFKILNPNPLVNKTLERAGFTSIFEIYTDLEKAIASF